MALLQTNPPAVIIVNDDLSTPIKNALIRQLRVDEVIDGYTFDQRIIADSDWVSNMKNIQNQRIMVVRPFTEENNRSHADIVAFVSNGMITVLQNKFGPPISSYPVQKIHWGQLCVFVKQKGPGNIKNTCCGCGKTITCNMSAELDELNRRVCSACSCTPTYKTLLVPLLPNDPRLKGI